MASPVNPPTPVRSASRSRGIQKSPNPSRRDKVRQGKLIRCWTDEEENFLFRSRTQGQKVSYKHIATRLDRTERACRLHFHHMTVGRKGHGNRTEEFDDDHLSENSDQSSLSTLPPAPELPAHGGFESDRRQRELADDSAPNQHRLPNFEAFLRDTFHHHRSTSTPGPMAENTIQGNSRELQVHNSTRPTRTLSGTWLKDHRSLEPQPFSQPQTPPSTLATSRPSLVPYQSTVTYAPMHITNSRYQPLPSPYEHRN